MARASSCWHVFYSTRVVLTAGKCEFTTGLEQASKVPALRDSTPQVAIVIDVASD